MTYQHIIPDEQIEFCCIKTDCGFDHYIKFDGSAWDYTGDRPEKGGRIYMQRTGWHNMPSERMQLKPLESGYAVEKQEWYDIDTGTWRN